MRMCLVLESEGTRVEALFAREAPSERVHGGARDACRPFRTGPLVFVVCFLIQLSAGAQVKALGRALIIYESSPHSPLTSLVDQGIRSALENSPYLLKEKGLPPDSVVLNRQQSVWESYKWYIVGAIALILAETAVILALVWQRAWRRKAEGELAITCDRLRLAVEAGHSVGWDWDIKNGGDQKFGDLQTMFGITSGTHSGYVDEFRNFVHPEDRELVWNALTDARQGGKPYMCEFRVVRKDGIVRWITARGKFYYGNNGEAERMLGMAVDITERKMAEQALTSLTGRLIEAQEEERRRIACEIHDNYQQRLALLAMDLEALAEDFRDSGGAGPHLYDFSNRASELGADLHSLSHRLYSSTLQSLGLVAGIRAFCEEFAEQEGIQVDFVHESVPRAIPKDAALCFFRVAQEGLCNIKRHSGADSAEVGLECIRGQLHLSVRDRGKGFDANQLAAEYGIGIRSMEERVRLLGGHLEIRSRPKEGTRIDAYLPLRIACAAGVKSTSTQVAP